MHEAKEITRLHDNAIATLQRYAKQYDTNANSKKYLDTLSTLIEKNFLMERGVRISELLDLKKENVHLDEQYFDVIDSKTENGIRKVPIADKVLAFYKNWYNDYSDSNYLLHTDDGKKFSY